MIEWTCHVCGDLRPDDKISVYSTEKPFGTTGVMMKQNVRYCNDRPSCIEGAKHIDFMAKSND